MQTKRRLNLLFIMTILASLFSDFTTSKEITIGTVETSNRGFIDDYGQFQGSSYEIVNSIVSDAGFTYQNTLMPFGRVLRYLDTGEVSVALLVPNEITNKVAIPIEYIRDVNFIVVGTKDTKIDSLNDINGKSVGYLRLTPTATKALKDIKVMQVEGSKYTHMIEMLMRNRIDFLFGPESSIFWALRNLNYSHEDLSTPLLVHKLGMYLMYSREIADKQTMSALVSSAKKLKDNNTINNIIIKYETPKYQ